MRLALGLWKLDLLVLELGRGANGLYVDLSLFQWRAGEPAPEDEYVCTTADLTGTSSGSYDLAEGPVWSDDQPVVVHAFGFGRAPSQRLKSNRKGSK